MKKVMEMAMGLVVLIILSLGVSPESQGPVVGGGKPSGIRDATALIEMHMPNLDQILDKNQFVTYGIGTLIRVNDHTLLITHNHWRKVLEDITIVRFYDAGCHLIQTIIGKEYRELVLQAAQNADLDSRYAQNDV